MALRRAAVTILVRGTAATLLVGPKYSSGRGSTRQCLAADNRQPWEQCIWQGSILRTFRTHVPFSVIVARLLELLLLNTV